MLIMYLEIAIEAIALLAMVMAAHIVGWKSVRLEEVPYPYDGMAHPKRKISRVKHAIELRDKFERRNARALRSDTMIMLPSVSHNWIVGCIVGAVMGFLFTRNHLDGIAQLLVAPQDHDLFYDYWFALMGIWFVAFMISAWVAEWVIPNAAKAKATEAGMLRIKKGYTARFTQKFSLDEILEIAIRYLDEQKAERKQRKTVRRCQKKQSATLSVQKQSQSEVIQFARLPKAANGRW